jgi:hypothetical protein
MGKQLNTGVPNNHNNQMGKTLKAQEEETHLFLGYRVVGTGLGVPPAENPKILAIMRKI